VSPALRVIIVDERPERAALLEAALAEAGHRVVARLVGRADLADRVDELEPDVIVVDMECPDRDTLEDMSRISDRRPRPMVMFVDRSDSASIQAAVQAGVSAYVVGGLSAERVKSVLEVAIARFNEFQALRRELESARSSLAERKVIERAKGILMKHRGMDEEEAFRALRKMAMDKKVRLGAVAREVVAAAELLS
jgi:two-component system, response regulator / RNA-binding antiterminator